MILWIGGFICGCAAGAAARYGQLCSMGAIEDALIGGNSRSLKAWGLALATAIIATQLAQVFGLFDPSESIYASTTFDWPIALIGGTFFGLGMALVGTCGFGLLVRLGGGDLRSFVTAILLGIVAFSVNTGALTPLRSYFSNLSVVEFASKDRAFLPTLLQSTVGSTLALIICGFIVCFLVSSALSDGRLLRRPRLMASAVALGLAVTGGWIITGLAYNSMATAHIESLSFVAPVGRAVLQLMSENLRDIDFSVACVLGVVSGSILMAVMRNEFHWEAFDDAREMRRHILGAALMGFGGILAKGCTIGQGLTAGSVLTLTSPVVIAGIFIGAKLGLVILLGAPHNALLGWRH
jgi:uncharacterized protein